jgi:hypothetical protein
MVEEVRESPGTLLICRVQPVENGTSYINRIFMEI